MILLKLSSGTIQELIDCTDSTPLECTMFAIACPIMVIVFHTSGATIYSSHTVNFLQYSGVFFCSGSIPRRACSMTYLVLVKYGCNDEIIEAKVRKCVVQKLALYLLQHNPKYNIFVLNLLDLNYIPKHGIIDNLIILYDKENYDGVTNLTNNGNEYSGGNIDSTVPMSHIRYL